MNQLRVNVMLCMCVVIVFVVIVFVPHCSYMIVKILVTFFAIIKSNK